LKHANLLSAAADCLLKSVVACVIAAAASSDSRAQTPAAPAQSTQVATADEDFELNIDSRRISEKDFHAETAVETDGARGLHIGVGVALRARDIEVLLLGVRGRVRFRASLAPVLRLLDARRAAPATAQPPPP
jgi:hypothetical protein